MPRCRRARCRAPRGWRSRWASWRSASTCSPAADRCIPGWSRRAFAVNIVLPAAIFALTSWLAGRHPPIAVNIALSLLIVAAIGLFLYRIAFQPLAHTSVLVLLIASVGCHLALQGFGLVFFGAEGQRGPTIVGCGLHHRPAALHRPEHRGLRHHDRLHRRRCGCSSASRSMARRCAPPPSIASARGWSASAPRCRDRSRSCWPR